MTDTLHVPATAPAEDRVLSDRDLRRYFTVLERGEASQDRTDTELAALARLTFEQQWHWEKEEDAVTLLTHHTLPPEALAVLLEGHSTCHECPVLPRVLAQPHLSASLRRKALRGMLTERKGRTHHPLWDDPTQDRAEMQLIFALHWIWPYSHDGEFQPLVSQVLLLPRSVQEIFCTLVEGVVWQDIQCDTSEEIVLRIRDLLQIAQSV